MAALDHRQTKQVPYVLITPAHNEEAHIGAAARSVVQQTLQPVRWVVVNDASSDRTSEIAKAWGAERPFIRVVDVRRAPGRDFGNKVRAFNAGLQCLRGLDYRYLGNLDADISLGPDYYARIIAELEQDPRIGIAGGMVQSKRGNRFVSQRVALDSVAGAVQFFRRECFEDVGVLIFPGACSLSLDGRAADRRKHRCGLGLSSILIGTGSDCASSRCGRLSPSRTAGEDSKRVHKASIVTTRPTLESTAALTEITPGGADESAGIEALDVEQRNS
jgi:hypothetical protein